MNAFIKNPRGPRLERIRGPQTNVQARTNRKDKPSRIQRE